MMHVLYALKLKLRLSRNPFIKSFYCANKPYTRGLKLKLLRNEGLKNRGHIMTTLRPHYGADATKAVLSRKDQFYLPCSSLYVNDLPKVSHFKTTLFADDTCLILANKNIDILEKVVDQEINKVDSWMRHNKLSLNYSKTVYMIFNSDKKQSSPFRVQIGSNLINRDHSTKYLGMHLDDKINRKCTYFKA